MNRWYFIILLALLFSSCARVGSPVGGDKDTIPPKFLGSNIDTPRINVSRDLRELRIAFDEYITLKDVNKNLIISPPINRIKKILPANLSTKEILIQWEDTLQANKTYSFNFGNSIQDNNEGNPLPYFTYAFSTGDKIDDLYMSGEISDGLKISQSQATNRVVGLYQNKDSIDYRQKPYYIARVDDDGYYELNYLSPGSYKIIAFEDENSNSIYDEGKEKVAFSNEEIRIDSTSISGFGLRLFPSQKKVKYLDMKPMNGGVLMLFEGKPEKVSVKPLNEKLKSYQVTHFPKSDSVKIWFDAKNQNIGVEANESLKFSYDSGVKKDSVSLFYKIDSKDEMFVENRKGSVLSPKSPFKITSNYIITKIQPEKWTLSLDSLTTVPFTAKISETNPYEILINADYQEGKKYQLLVPSKTVSSYFQTTNTTKRFDFEAGLLQNFGSITIQLTNKPNTKFWIQLLNSSEDVVYSQYTLNDIIKFDVVKPEDYYVRILVDNNENGNWEGVDFQNKIFAEDSYLFYKKISARPLWEIVEPWDLKDQRKLDVIKLKNEPKKQQQEPSPSKSNTIPNRNFNTNPNNTTSPSRQQKRGNLEVIK